MSAAEIGTMDNMAALFDLQGAVRPNIWELTPYRCARDVSEQKIHYFFIKYATIKAIHKQCCDNSIGLQRRNSS